MNRTLSNSAAFLTTALLSLAATTCLWMTDDDRMLHPDIAQAISGAKNMLAGNGYRTSLIYYEQHYKQEAWPAAQTVFPFGYPLMIAAASEVGVPFRMAAQLLSLTGFFFVPLLIFKVAKIMGREPTTAMLLAVMWQLSPMNWSNVHEKQTESLFVAFTLCSMLFLMTANPSFKTLFFAGASAAVACSLRYAGAFWLLTVGFAMVPGFFGHWWMKLRQSIIFILLPAATMGGMFLRNRLIVGDIRGGISSLEVKSWRSTLENIYYALSRLVGLDQDQLQKYQWPEILVTIAILSGLLLVLISVTLRYSEWRQLRNRMNTGHASGYVYLIVTMAALTWLEKTTSVNLSPRMILPLLPFALLVTADLIAFARESLESSMPGRFAVVSASTMLCVGILMAQYDVYAEIKDQPERLGLVADALLSPNPTTQSAQSPTDTIVSTSDVPTSLDRIRGQRVLTNESHMLAEVTGEGTLGLTAGVYTMRPWSNAEVETFVRSYGVQFVVVFTAISPKDDNPFFDGLIADQGDEALPHWLVPDVSTTHLRLYRIVETEHSNGLLIDRK